MNSGRHLLQQSLHRSGGRALILWRPGQTSGQGLSRLNFITSRFSSARPFGLRVTDSYSWTLPLTGIQLLRESCLIILLSQKMIIPAALHSYMNPLTTHFLGLDGYAQEDRCGGGAILYLSNLHLFNIEMGLGGGSNNFIELSTGKFLIQFALEKCKGLQLFGDSQVVFDWLNKNTRCYTYTLRHILDDALQLSSHFDFSYSITFSGKGKQLPIDYLRRLQTGLQALGWSLSKGKGPIISIITGPSWT